MNYYTETQLLGKNSTELRQLVRQLRQTNPHICTGVEAANVTVDEAKALLTGKARNLADARYQISGAPSAMPAHAPTPTPTPRPAPVMATTTPTDLNSAAAAFAEALAQQQQAPQGITRADMDEAIRDALAGHAPAIDEQAVKDIARETIEDATIQADPEDLKTAITEVLQDLGKNAAPTLRRAVKAAARAAGTASPLEMALDRFCNPANPSRPLLLAGPAGTGKTTHARQHGKQFDNCFEYQAAKEHRLTHLLGKDIPVPVNGALGFAWTDSPISQAFRAAAKGETTLLILDELFRLTGDTRKALLSALAPTLDGYYKLVTGRVLSVVDGVADVETIRAPADKLAIVATTNAGTQYSLEESCPAEAERFKYEFIATDWQDTQQKLEHAATEYGWTNPTYIADQLVRVGQTTERLQSSCQLWHSASLRTLARALRDAEPNDNDSLKSYLMDEATSWTAKDADGRPMQAQLDQVKQAIDNTL